MLRPPGVRCRSGCHDSIREPCANLKTRVRIAEHGPNAGPLREPRRNRSKATQSPAPQATSPSPVHDARMRAQKKALLRRRGRAKEPIHRPTGRFLRLRTGPTKSIARRDAAEAPQTCGPRRRHEKHTGIRTSRPTPVARPSVAQKRRPLRFPQSPLRAFARRPEIHHRAALLEIRGVSPKPNSPRAFHCIRPNARHSSFSFSSWLFQSCAASTALFRERPSGRNALVALFVPLSG